jgi:TonB family protein
MLIVVVAMAFKLSVPTGSEDETMIIDPQFMEEILEEQEKLDQATQDELDEIEIEKYINEIRNVGSSSRIKTEYANIDAMSEAELKEMYESELLKEKYGADYEKRTSSNNNDDDDKVEPIKTNTQKTENSSNNSTIGTYAGPALVYVELKNPDRGKSYIHVPVFTCKDGGKVVIDITIGSDGSVKTANVASTKSTGDATCISNAARDAALKSKFTPIAGGKTETGKITYSFMQQ